jgi:L-threonylcarbamoyladenylate synthase
LPTETVYGLGCDARSDQAVAAVYALKGRPTFNPLIVHVDSLQAAQALVQFDPLSLRLAQQFWPGPLTLVLPRRPDCAVSWLVSAGLDTLAVRVPAHPLALRLLKACAIPIAAPSANPSGRLSPTRAEHVDLGDPQLAVLDGGPCAVGVESTVVRVIDAEAWLLRPGGLDRQKIQQIAGVLRQPSPEPGLDPSAPHSPGQLLAHYAPQRPVRLNATQVQANEALLAFGSQPLPGAGAVLNLSERGDTTEAAAHLFAYLRALDRQPFCAIAVMPIPQDGLGEAIADRLQRAAVGSNRAA